MSDRTIKKRLWIKWASLAIVILLAVIFFIRKVDQGKAKDRKDLGKVSRQDILQRVTIPGTIMPRRKTFITAPYKGYVRKIFVKLGEEVKSGDPVASVGTTLLVNDQVFPLRAPFSGRVVAVNKEEGEFIKDSDPADFIARIDDLSEIFIDGTVAEIDRLKIKKGQEGQMKASAIGNKVYKAVVVDLFLAAKEKDKWERSTVVEFPVRLRLVDPDDDVKSGMSVLMDIITEKKMKVLTLRHEFIQQKGDDFFVLRANGEEVPVKLGMQNDEVAEITEGLLEGDEIRRVNFSEMTSK